MQSEEDSSLLWCTECVESTIQQMLNVKSNNIRIFSILWKLHRERRRRSACIFITIHSMNFPFADDATFQNIMTVTQMTSNKTNRQKAKQSETRTTTSVLKQDPNTHKKVKKNAVYYDRTQPANFRGNPLFKLQNNS